MGSLTGWCSTFIFMEYFCILVQNVNEQQWSDATAVAVEKQKWKSIRVNFIIN